MKKTSRALLIAGIILVACGMRAPIVGVGPLIGQIKQDLNLGSAISGMITTIPIVAFAAVAPFAGRIAARWGTGKTMVASLVIVAGGIALRSFGGRLGFFGGAVLLGVGIAFGNVLLPSIIKSVFPSRVGLLTGIYTTCIALFSGISAGVSIPLAQGSRFGWRGALAVWLFLALGTLLVWFSQWSLRTNTPPAIAGDKPKSIFKSPTAWCVSVFMGMQSLIFYSFVAWLPSILQARGIAAATAGYYASIYQWLGIPSSFIVPMLAAKMRDQRLLAGIIAGLYFAGLSLFLLNGAGPVIVLGVMICGFCTGACLSLAMCLMGLRTDCAAQTASLSGMAQALGYAIAAVSPTLLGAIYDRAASWTIPILFLMGMTVVLFVAGMGAGKKRTI